MLSKYFYQRSSEHVKNFPVCGNRVRYNQSTDWQMDVVLGVQHRITGLRSGVLPFLHLQATPKPLRQHPMKETECRQLPYSHIICGVFATLSCITGGQPTSHSTRSHQAKQCCSAGLPFPNVIITRSIMLVGGPTRHPRRGSERERFTPWHPQSEPHPSASQPQNKGRCYTLDVVIGRNASEWVSV